MNKKILVTGFQPFLGEKTNPSELLLTEIKKVHLNAETLLLPVSYDQSFSILKNHYFEQGPYDVILMLGQAGGRKAVCLERIAINWYETAHSDEEGACPTTGRIIPGEPDAFISDFFPTEWKAQLSQIAPVEVSHSAGTFVCNSLYYRAHAELKSTAKNGPAILFIHLPYLPEQAAEKAPDTPAMELATQLKVILALTELIKAN